MIPLGRGSSPWATEISIQWYMYVLSVTLAIVLSVLLAIVLSPFGHCIVCPFDHCIVCPFGHCVVCPFGHCIVCPFGHCIVCPLITTHLQKDSSLSYLWIPIYKEYGAQRPLQTTVNCIKTKPCIRAHYLYFNFLQIIMQNVWNIDLFSFPMKSKIFVTYLLINNS
jgi:hypothetical protein